MSRQVVEIPIEVWEQCQRDAGTIASLHKECIRLNAEVKRLTTQGEDSEPRFVLLSEYQHLKGLLAFATTKYCRLEAEVERLRKAGDNLARAIDDNGCHDNGDWYDQQNAIYAWNAAKEVQS